jgi:tRNA(Ile)-lysidine synthase
MEWRYLQTMRANLLREIEVPVQNLLDRVPRLVLAISGGVDSAVLLDAVARLRTPAHHVVVATLDHGTGTAATDAVALAAATAARHRVRLVTERLAPGPGSEAEWRRQRWRFLRQVAARERAVVVTAHTRDDQVETVVMRLLRGAGARGLAGLYAPSSVERPLISASRADVLYYARRRRVAYVNDPSNLSVAFLRNRVRLNLLPAIRAVHPGFDNEILDLAHRAAQVRAATDAVAQAFIVRHRPGEVIVDAAALGELDDEGRRLIWPSIAALAGCQVDRRGIVRLADLTNRPIGAVVQVSGGFEAGRGRTEIALRFRSSRDRQTPASIRRGAEFGNFRFTVLPLPTLAAVPGEPAERDRDPWRIRLDDSLEPVVREWVPGDRLTLDSHGSRRRVKRFLAEAGIPGPDRAGWPVVVVDGDVVWIPGVRAGVQSTGTSSTVEYRCERHDD